MAEIRCPMCSKWNPADLQECQYCHARLKPLISPSQSSEQPSEPEGDVPDWLSSLRGRQDLSASNEPASGGETPPAEETPDWLGRLRENDKDEASSPASARQDNDLPDWLSSSSAGAFTQDAPAPEEDQPAAAAEEVPDWLRSIREQSEQSAPSGPTPSSGQVGENSTPASEPDWVSQFRSAQPPAQQPSSDEPASSEASGEPDWLQQLRSQPGSDAESSFSAPSPQNDIPAFPADDTQPQDSVPSWLNEFSIPSARPTPPADVPPAEQGDTPDWLRSLSAPDSGTAGQAAPQAETPQNWSSALSSGDLPDWLNNITADNAAQAAQSSTVKPFENLPSSTEPGQASAPDAQSNADWLSAFESEIESPASDARQADAGETPDWLNAFKDSSPADVAPPPSPAPEMPTVPQLPANTDRGGMTGWLGHVDAVNEAPTLSSEAQGERDNTPQADGVAADMPDWLASLQEKTNPAGESSEPSSSPVPGERSELPVAPFADVNLPDWISDLGPAVANAETTPAGPFVESRAAEPEPASEAEGLTPVELPSWVQAMRPVESAAPASEAQVVQEKDSRVENSGPLAGLRGILPVEPGVGDYRRPPIYSVKLQVNETQRRSAQILEDLLASENVPLPPKAEHLISSQQIMRLLVALVLIAAVVLGSIFPQTLIPIPQADTQTGLNLVVNQIESLPQGAAVLLAVDYEPALMGEMEPSSAAVLAHLMMKNARLAVISTNPTGPALAEHLFQYLGKPQDGRVIPTYIQAYANDPGGNRIARLGYVAGGPSGLLGFALNPRLTAPAYLADNTSQAWDRPAMKGVQSVNDFKAVVVLTDSVDTGRSWMEQFQPNLQPNIPILMVTSAQAAPILRAYLDGGQVDGMVSGLAGGAVYARSLNASGSLGLPSLVQNWNAFQGGMLVTLVLILLGGLVNAFLGLRSRGKTKEKA